MFKRIEEQTRKSQGWQKYMFIGSLVGNVIKILFVIAVITMMFLTFTGLNGTKTASDRRVEFETNSQSAHSLYEERRAEAIATSTETRERMEAQFAEAVNARN